ncbi:MAG TPA: ATP-binding protein [Candidatus Udaeobacter sp.]|nr:ATP-binding protein [Candidatus Udaeobacter sp.]
MDAIRTPISNMLRRSRTLSLVIVLLLVLLVGIADYFSGYQIYWSIFYLVAISVALWNVGVLFAVLVAALSITSWLVGDWAAGVVYPNRFVPVWNALITFGFYLIVIWLLTRLKSFQQTLERRIRERTAALQQEVAARERLERAVAEVTERERLHIGRELHDTVCQHLTATSLSLQVLSGKLAEDSLPQARDADQAVHLVEDAIYLTRKLAKGLFPLELAGEGLGGALLGLCRDTAELYQINCEFKNHVQTPSIGSTAAMHLYRIAQEAVMNAIKHGHVSQVVVGLSIENGTLTMRVNDDGIGLPDQLPADRGLGLRIMASRAGMIGAHFSAKNNSAGGAMVTCELPLQS